MSFVQNLWRDLVDKRLWPVAVALVLAAIAVPVLIGTGSGPAPGAAASAPLPSGAPAAVPPQIAVAVAPADTPRNRAGASRDPFRALVFAKVAKTPAATGAATTLTPPSSPAAAKPPAAATAVTTTGGLSVSASPRPVPAGTGTAAAPVTTTTTRTPPTPAGTTSTKLLDYELWFQVKRSGKLMASRGVRALSYVPSTAYPLLSFLGVKPDGKTATFLVSDGVTLAGAGGVCRPSRTSCRFLELKAGDNILLAKTPPAGQAVRHFRLMLQRVALTEVRKVTTPATTGARSTRAVGSGDWLRQLNLAPAHAVVHTTG